MAKKSRPETDTNGWMNTYADLVTLLLCFFVLLYSMSVIDADKWQRFAQAFKDVGRSPEEFLENPVIMGEGEPGDLIPEDIFPSNPEQSAPIDLENPKPQSFDDLYDYLVSYTEARGMEDSVEITQGENSVYIRFSNNIFFFPDSATLKQESYPVLDFIGDCLYSVEDQIYLININGHTASVDYEYYPVSSWTLSGERATNIAIFFEGDKDIDPKKLRPTGYADNYPVADNTTEEGRRQNRRVDMVIVSNQDTDITLPSEFMSLINPDFPQDGGMSNIMIPGNDSGVRSSRLPQVPRDFGVPARPDSLIPAESEGSEAPEGPVAP